MIEKLLKNKSTFFLLLFILILGAYFRFTGIDWDQGQHLHPDERYMTMVTNDIKWPSSLGEYLDPQSSKLNPVNNNQKNYIYGDLPLFIVKGTVLALGQSNYRDITLDGRILSGVINMGSLLLVFFLAKRFFSVNVSLFSAFIYAISVIVIQQSHFYTTDVYLEFFTLLSFYFLITFVRESKLHAFAGLTLSAIFLGMAFASKISAVYFGIVVAAVFLLKTWRIYKQNYDSNKNSFPKKSQTKQFIKDLLLLAAQALGFILIAYLVFRILNPYLFTSSNLFNFTINPDIKSTLDFNVQASAGNIMFPPAYRWIGKPAFVYPLYNIFFWGLGLPVLVLFSIGTALVFKKYFKKDALLLLFWIITGFLTQGGNFTKEARYFLYLIPFIAIITGVGCNYLLNRKKTYLLVVLAFFLLLQLLWAVAFLKIYQNDNTRVSASIWINQHIPENSQILEETWDDPIPVNVPEERGIAKRKYNLELFDVWGDDNLQKLHDFYYNLNKSDYYITTSPRASWTIGRLPDKFPYMVRFYASLEDGSLGFKKVATFTSYPRFLGVIINDSAADESFWVYDHAQVNIYRKEKMQDFDSFKKKLAE